MILEELGNIGGAIDSLSHLMSAGRSRNIRCHLVLQSLSQLNSIYGPCEAATIIENTSVLIAFRTNNWDTLTELSNKCGTWELECNGKVIRDPVITQKQLAVMETGQALVWISSLNLCYITWLPHYGQLFEVDHNSYIETRFCRTPEDNTVELFDIKEVAKQMRRKEIEEQLKDVKSIDRLVPSRPPLFAPKPVDILVDDHGIDLEALMRDIDAKIAELDAMEEAKKKEEAPEG